MKRCNFQIIPWTLKKELSLFVDKPVSSGKAQATVGTKSLSIACNGMRKEGKINVYEVWADLGAAYLASKGELRTA
jgi:hypothetical protein